MEAGAYGSAGFSSECDGYFGKDAAVAGSRLHDGFALAPMSRWRKGKKGLTVIRKVSIFVPSRYGSYLLPEVGPLFDIARKQYHVWQDQRADLGPLFTFLAK